MDFAKLAKSQGLPSNLMDDKVNQLPAGIQTHQQDVPAEKVFDDLFNLDHLSDLNTKDFKAMEVDNEQATGKTLSLIHDKEQKPKDKGKAVEAQGQPMKMKKEVATQRPVDEATGSSNVFSMAQW